MADAVRTSEVLKTDTIYTRAELADMFGIRDATINTGIFQPKHHASVWLFVTERKTSDRTQYVDRLDGDVLYWQGQTMGAKDRLIIEHDRRGLELLLFFRRKKYEHPSAGFRYEGRFAYQGHSGSGPTSFVLERREDPGIAADLKVFPSETTSALGRELLSRLAALRVWSRGSDHAPHKPLLVLLALARVRQGLPRLMEFSEIEDQLRGLIEIAIPGRAGHPEYPFWRLRIDRIWEVPDANRLSTGAGISDPPIAELRKERVQGGLLREFYDILRADSVLLQEAARIAASQLPAHSRDVVVHDLGWSPDLFDPPQPMIDVPYIEVDDRMAPTTVLPEPDPDLFGRGVAAHSATQTALADFLRSHGAEPRSAGSAAIAFDLLWHFDGSAFVAEVKSLTEANEERQLHLGLGQVLRYQQAVRHQSETVAAVLVVEREPSDRSWIALCEEHGVELLWPETFGCLVNRAGAEQ